MSRRCRSTGMRESCSPGSTTQRHSATAVYTWLDNESSGNALLPASRAITLKLHEGTRTATLLPPTVSPNGSLPPRSATRSRPPAAASSCRARSLPSRVASSHVPGTAHRSPSRDGGWARTSARLGCAGAPANSQGLRAAYWRRRGRPQPAAMPGSRGRAAPRHPPTGEYTKRIVYSWACAADVSWAFAPQDRTQQRPSAFSCSFALSERVRSKNVKFKIV